MTKQKEEKECIHEFKTTDSNYACIKCGVGGEIPTPPKIEEWEKELYKEFYNELYYRDAEELYKPLVGFITQATRSAREEVKRELLKWIFDNHDHHEFADELLPKDCYGCEDKDFPYVNSMKLEKFIKSIIEEKV